MKFLIYSLSLVMLLISVSSAAPVAQSSEFSDPENDTIVSLDDTPVVDEQVDITSVSYELRDHGFTFTIDFLGTPQINDQMVYYIYLSWDEDQDSSSQIFLRHNQVYGPLADNTTEYSIGFDGMIEGPASANIEDHSAVFSVDDSGLDLSGITSYQFTGIYVEVYRLFASGNHFDKLDYDSYPRTTNPTAIASTSSDTALVGLLAAVTIPVFRRWLIAR